MKRQLTLPVPLQAAMTRFDAMTIRERVLIGSALLAGLLVMWDTLLMQPLNARRTALIAVMETDPSAAQSSIETDPTNPDAAATVIDPDPIGTALLERESLRAQLADTNKQLQQVSAD